jgi:hypothetical protein
VTCIEYRYAGPEWQKLSATEKRNQLWSSITHNDQSGKWRNSLPVLLGEMYSKYTMDSKENDQLPLQGDDVTIKRVKVIHSVGYTCKARYVSHGNHNYTGVFTGADNIIIRASTATEPKEDTFGAIGPALAVKFLRSNVHSANYVVLWKLEGQGNDMNFFSKNFTNHNPPLGLDASSLLKAVALSFSTVTPYFYATGLSDLAKYDQNGREYHPNFPYQIMMTPNEKLRSRTITPELRKLENQMANTDPETYPLFYQMHAQKEPNDPFVHIGDFMLESKPVPSYFADEHLYFRHQRMDEDLVYRPDWIKPFQQATIAEHRKNTTCFWDYFAFSRYIIPKIYPQNLLRNILCPIYF